MRVLALSNLYPPDVLGGYEIACAQVVDALRERGHEVLVLAGRPRRPIGRPDPPHVRRVFDLTDEWSAAALGRHPVAIRLKIARSRLVNAHNVSLLTQTLDTFRPDVVYLNNLVGLGGLGLVATLGFLGVPWLWHLGDYIPKELCSDLDGLVPGLADVFGREIRGSFISVSERVVSEPRSEGIALNGPVELIPYWITGERPPPRERFYRPGEPLRVISVGRVDSQKGVDLLIETASLLRKGGVEDVTFDVFGKVVDPAFAGQVRSLGLDGVVNLRGPRPHAEILKLYADYDLLLFPTRRREPFGIVPLEAASRGCVPVITDDCGVGEWVVHGVHALKAARKPEAFAAVIRDVIEGTVPLAPLARRAAETVWRDFRLDAILPRIESQLRLASGTMMGKRWRADEAGEAYRMARLAEQMSSLLIQDALNG